MSRKTRRGIRHTPARVLVSDLLPFEVPVGFDNLGLYQFLIEMGMRREGPFLLFPAAGNDDVHILHILFGTGASVEPGPVGGYRVPLTHVRKATIPLQFNVRYREGRPRTLSIAHPSSQIALVDFYEEFRSLLLLHTGSSPFSIRYPNRISKYTFSNDSVFQESQGVSLDRVEINGLERPRLTSYFSYWKYGSLGRFFESTEYRRCEKKFGHLVRLDIAKCFDSIYTHSIAWAIFGKESVKYHRANVGSAGGETFADSFDARMRAMNDDETHGILIGPEISRIFAEVILQRIDREVESDLREAGLTHGEDYEILRYVDDYFIFIRAVSLKDRIIESLEHCLRPYRFHLNTGKEEMRLTPFISNLSVSRRSLRQALKQLIALHPGMVHNHDVAGFVDFQSTANEMISVYKTELRDSSLDSSALVSACLTYIEVQVEDMIGAFSAAEAARSSLSEDDPDSLRCARYNRRNLMRGIHAALEFAFFVYGGAPRVPAAIKLSRILALARKAGRIYDCSPVDRRRLDDLVAAEIRVQLNRNRMTRDASIEGLYLLTSHSGLGEEYALAESDVCRFAGIEDVGGALRIPEWHSVLTFADLVRLTSGRSEYARLSAALEEWAILRVQNLSGKGRRFAELPLLALTVLSSPSMSPDAKYQVVRALSPNAGRKAVERLADRHSRWFTNWDLGDLHDHLLRKRSEEVY